MTITLANLAAMAILGLSGILAADMCNHPELLKSRLMRLKWALQHSTKLWAIGGPIVLLFISWVHYSIDGGMF